MCFIGWSEKYGKKVISFMYNILHLYNEAMDLLIKPVDEHQNSISDSPEEVIKWKISVLTKLLIDISKTIEGKDGETSSVVILLTLQAYRRSIEYPDDESCSNSIFPHKGGDDLFMQLITARINLALTINNTSLVTGELAQQRKSKEARKELKHNTKVIKSLVDGGVKVDKNGFIDTKVKFLAYYFKEHIYSYFDTTNNKFGISMLLTAGDNDTSMLLKQSLHLIMLWLIALCNRQCNESSMESLALPSHIDEWLDSIKNAEIGYKAKKTLCGDTGERRVSSILSGSIYRWLEARCSEWQAELARDELLQSMDVEEPSVSPKGECKSRKKKKGSPNRVDHAVETLVENKDTPETVKSRDEAKEDEAVLYPLVVEGISNELASNTESSSPRSVKAEEGVFVANEHTTSPIDTQLLSSANLGCYSRAH